MKKIITALTLCAAIMTATNTDATIRRVGYFGTPVAGVDYATWASAHAAANGGDTIHLYPNTTAWSGTVSKKLVVIGKGYLTNGTGSNPNLQYIPDDVSVSFSLAAGCDSSLFMGISDGTIVTASVNINAITIKRCKLDYVQLANGTYNYWRIHQCMLTGTGTPGLHFTGSTGLATNLNVSNTYIGRLELTSGAAAGISGQISNCFFDGTPGFDHHMFENGTFLIQNCIFGRTAATINNISNCTFLNNIAAGNILPNSGTSSGNQNSVSMAATLVGYPTQGANSSDGRFQIVPSGPADNTGVGGTDCGIFGGVDPYRLSGIPPIPAFYNITAPTTVTTNPYTIQFSVRGNN